MEIPERALVVLCGPAGSGKSTWAAKRFRPAAVVSSDACRALILDDPADRSAPNLVFELLHAIIELRLYPGRLTVVDSTAVTHDARKALLDIARQYAVPAHCVAFDVPLEECLRRDALRERRVGREIIEKQHERFRDSLPRLANEGFVRVWIEV